MLVLSRFAGAARELTDAVLVNPFDIDAMAEAIHRALTMPLAERQARWHSMMRSITTNTAAAWQETFLKLLQNAVVSAPV
ncbi:MAG: trehalose-6-phosphate synthase [Stellaceae bacterium]